MTTTFQISDTTAKISAIKNGKEIGSISLEMEDGRWQVWDTEVTEEERGNGVATKLYTQLVVELARIDIDCFYSDAEFMSPAINNIYEKIGGQLCDVDDDRRYKVNTY